MGEAIIEAVEEEATTVLAAATVEEVMGTNMAVGGKINTKVAVTVRSLEATELVVDTRVITSQAGDHTMLVEVAANHTMAMFIHLLVNREGPITCSLT